MPALRALLIRGELWGALPESWGRSAGFTQLAAVILGGRNRLHGLADSARPSRPLVVFRLANAGSH